MFISMFYNDVWQKPNEYKPVRIAGFRALRAYSLCTEQRLASKCPFKNQIRFNFVRCLVSIYEL